MRSPRDSAKSRSIIKHVNAQAILSEMRAEHRAAIKAVDEVEQVLKDIENWLDEYEEELLVREMWNVELDEAYSCESSEEESTVLAPVEHLTDEQLWEAGRQNADPIDDLDETICQFIHEVKQILLPGLRHFDNIISSTQIRRLYQRLRRSEIRYWRL
ncbi:hypothetical protein KC19_7G084600 [Ceratodon purpureus]|uniref:Uncharacterized protein n=1 Tax=Ceratodon purpureus TaxID=3225 RepID=A0A8T0H8S2_CERPU|nr:hypothetical protein KC19_7G084600 [Ceratodon purpureus]